MTDSALASLASGLRAALSAAGVRDTLTDSTTCAAYSSDASLYRVVPRAVVRPHDADEVAATLQVCRELGVPLTARGAGTSIAGNAVGAGVVLDFSRHMNRVLELDPEARTARVQAGTVHAVLQRQALAHGLRFGPDPSSHSRCTIGGMIGNNACGSRALGYGRTSDNVVAMQLLAGSGEPGTAPRLVQGARELVAANLAVIRTEFGQFGRQVSGYALEHLLPERGIDLTRALVGSEGTLGVLTEATVALVSEPAWRTLVVLGYPDIASAGDAAPAVLAFGPTACEGLDRRIVDVLRQRRGPASVPELPRGAAWLFVELVGTSAAEVQAGAARLIRDCGALDGAVVGDPRTAAALWRVREDGAGLSGRSPAGLPAHAGWEDAAVPPARLGAYLRDFDVLLTDAGLTGLPYGHFGDGCLHVRLDFPLEHAGGVEQFSAFLDAAARLVVSYGGSLSGEHGDGRARSEYLPLMYSAQAIAAFGALKQLFDPENLLNPGVLVDPVPATAALRIPQANALRTDLALAYHADGGDFSQAVHRCTGVGKCRADNTATGGVMCPSYLATREEKDSTRGRARVLQEMVNGGLVNQGWRSPEVHEALDLCLSCKGCASDCPTGIDMASYKSEALHQSYRGRLRPRAHYTLGRLPRWLRLASRAPGLANRLLRLGARVPGGLRLGGVDARRSMPALAPQTFRDWFDTHTGQTHGKPVVLFVDTFTNHLCPEVGVAAVAVLEAAGWAPVLPPRNGCCALTWISTGQLDTARRILGDTLEQLAPWVARGVPIVGLEPSCTATLRSDSMELVGTDTARAVAGAVHTVAELLAGDADWQPPSLSGTTVLAQPHCHHHAVMGWSTDAELLRRAGAEVQRLGGCCGLAGNFGVELGHYEVSVAVAEQQLLPALRAVDEDTVVLADGFSCRTQISDLTERRGQHLAELLADHLLLNRPNSDE